MKQLIHENDKYKMNWVEGNCEWGTVKCPDSLTVKTSTKIIGDAIKETYTFTNNTNKEVFTSLKDISIYTTFNDNYEDAATCVTNKCHTHIWCGGNISYVMALRMGGEAPHLGLVLTKGSLGGYSIERDTSKMSNDRGDFLMHPSPITLAPNESYSIEWTLFWHGGKEDFHNKLRLYNEKYIEVKADNYIVFQGEEINITVSPAFKFNNVSIKNAKINGDSIIISETAKELGERVYDIEIDGIKTTCTILVLPAIRELAEKRCNFIADNQQYDNAKSRLDGAFLVYDNEEKHIYYNDLYDYNAGRERMGMGLLFAKYLQYNKDEKLNEALLKYIDFIKREIVDVKTGEVFNDYMCDNTYFRLYNYPWASLFFIEIYCLYNSVEYLNIAYKIMKAFYEQGGNKFYAIEVPIAKICKCLEKEQMLVEKDELLKCFREHSDFIIMTGTNYPSHEVNYEQSIVAPATMILLETYKATGEDKYLSAAKVQLSMLELFNANQPDYHMNEIAIRHWDGYWFGKRKLYGDTYPHYWSSLTGNAYLQYSQIIGDKNYAKKAKASFRGTLSLFMADGTASCAYLYPVTVNGEDGKFYDSYANDQDWGLYLMLRYIEEVEKF